MRPAKVAKRCEGCHDEKPARFRTLANLHLCGDCYNAFIETGQVPEPEPVSEGVVRW